MSHPVTPHGNDSGPDRRVEDHDDTNRLDLPLPDRDQTDWSDERTSASSTTPLGSHSSADVRDSSSPNETVAPQRIATTPIPASTTAPQRVVPAETVVVREAETADLLTQEKDEFGGIKFGSALLGWLTTVGTIVVLAAILAAIASGLNLDSNTSSSDLRGVGLGAAIALLVVLFLGYLAGGYVAGRMARFHGIRQGLAVWLWGVVIAIALSITAAIVGNQSTVLVQANLPQIPFTSSGFTWQAILALVAVLVITLLGALLGGLWGMRFHRKIDKFAATNTHH
ncbi:MAG: hypothetical protein WKF57_17120, partial [Nakamurella sp.]